MRIGNGYLGTDSVKTSVAGQELLPSKPVDWTESYKLYKFSFINYDLDCSVLINNETTIFLKANQGFEMSEEDEAITSFKILTNGVSYTWIGAY
jgi:hypothetical protein